MFLSTTRQWACLALLTLLGCCWGTTASATHSMGFDLTYECLGGNQYEVTLNFYRDCNGIAAYGQSPIVNWSGSCGRGSIVMGNRVVEEITPSCPGIVGTACNGGNGIYGIEKHSFTGVVTLPAGCTDISFDHSICCRNAAITTLSNPLGDRLYVSIEMDDANRCNNSPVFTNDPVPFGCVGQPVLYNHGASDPDGDNLVYSLISCYDNDSATVSYSPGFNAANPLTTTNGVTINPNTGAISFTPSIAQVGVLCVAVDEYRNGVRIGRVVRDIQFTAVPCSNNIPTLSGYNGTNSYDTTITVGTAFCANLISADPDAGQTTQVNFNYFIPGANYSGFGSPLYTARICWTPTANDVGTYVFTATVSDDYCPIVGQNTYTYTITVVAPPAPCDSINVQITGTTDLACSNNDGTATIVASGGTAPYTYQVVNWATGTFYTSTTGFFDNLAGGNYSIFVQDANGCTPNCTGYTFSIGGNVAPLLLSTTVQDVACPSNSTNVRDSTNQTGSIQAGASGGTAPYLYSINGGSFNNTSGNFNNLGAGTYTIAVLDANGCSQTTTVTVGEPDPISIAASVTPASCGQANGSVTLSASGGTGSFLYYINGVSQNSPVFNNLAAGTYTFRVCDMNYCVYDTVITVPGVRGITAVASSTSPACAGDCNGTASVIARNANAGNYSILWSNGATSPTIGNLCAGTYSVTLTDANGCSDVASVTVSDPAPISVSLASTADETCMGNDGAATLNISGGSAPYTVDLANFTNGTTASNSTGIFTNLNAGQHVVNVTDANGCGVNCATSFLLDGCSGNGNTVVLSRTLSGSSGWLSVNPNPADNLVQVRYETNQPSVSINIIDANGKPLYNQAQNAGEGSVEVMVNGWAPATYFVILKGAEGQLIKTTKLVIR